MSAPQLIAHRGYARRYPENTLAAVQAALDAGARAIEVDVQLSRDRVPFLMHDRTLERMCGVAGSLGEKFAVELELLHASEVSRFGAEFEDERIASLVDFAALIERSSGVHAFVEIKRASTELFGPDAVLDAVIPKLERIRERCTLISFDFAVLARCRARFPHRVGPVLLAWHQLEIGDTASLRPDIVFCDVEKLPVDGPLSAGAPLAVYEVDDPSIARELRARGVAYIETFAIREMLEGLK